jgi:2-polyprenyl-3-methyl-5-hydroxy-6-metoxy-1,4-benzoquinol methylase
MNDKQIQEINNTLINFWNDEISLDEKQKKEMSLHVNPDQYERLASPKLFSAVSKLGDCNNMLDYGCGSGWASIVAAKSGCKRILAVDIGKDIIESADFHCRLFKVKERIETLSVPTDWLKSVPDCSYDGIVCNNVLDVIPFETSIEIIEQLSRVAQHGAKIVIGMNFHMTKEMAKERKMELVDDKYLFVNGVLRLMSLSDDEWISILEKYFKIENLTHFAWPGEKKETRRIFTLIKE